MQIHTLVTMANRIGQFFESYSDRNEALAEISNHIHKFWDPRMRRELLRRKKYSQPDLPAAGQGQIVRRNYIYDSELCSSDEG